MLLHRRTDLRKGMEEEDMVLLRLSLLSRHFRLMLRLNWRHFRKING